MRIVLFGVGLYLKNREKQLFENNEIVALVDSDKKKIGSIHKCFTILSPDAIKSLSYDYVVVTCMDYPGVKELLLSYGVEYEKICHYCQFTAQRMKKMIVHRSNRDDLGENQKKVLIAYTQMNTGGAAEAILNAILALNNLGVVTDLAVDIITENDISKLNEQKVDVIETTAIYAEPEMSYDWLNQYSLVIANSIDLLPFAATICCVKRTILWIHDPPSRISAIKNDFTFADGWEEKLRIYAVSDVARKGLTSVFTEIKDVGILPYGIPDISQKSSSLEKKDKMLFAIVGWIGFTKGQDILIEAISLLPQEVQKETEFWFVGGCDKQNPLLKQIEKMECAFYKGYFDRAKMHELYELVDVVVSSSREDMLPTVLVEGMSHKKTCITSDATGIAPLIEQGINGLVFSSENARELSEKIKWCVCHKEELLAMGERAREIYEKNFSMKAFEKNIAALLTKELAWESK